MLALAGYPLGVRCSFLDHSADAPGAQVAPILVGPLEDAALLAELASRSDVVTFDWENISGKALAPLEKLTAIRPPRAALEVSQDRLQEKALFRRLKIPVAAHAPVDSKEQLVRAIGRVGIPGVLKTRRMGYDGKGQFVLERERTDRCRLGSHRRRGTDLRKISSLLPRAFHRGRAFRGGPHRVLSVVRQYHAGGILRYGVAPFTNSGLERNARIYLKRVMNALDYIGVLTIEFFVVERAA